MKHILKCKKCGQYTMKDKCPKCKIKTENPKPVKYDPTDKIGKYRRIAKEKKNHSSGTKILKN